MLVVARTTPSGAAEPGASLAAVGRGERTRGVDPPRVRGPVAGHRRHAQPGTVRERSGVAEPVGAVAERDAGRLRELDGRAHATLHGSGAATR